jgi:hypothetical protein
MTRVKGYREIWQKVGLFSFIPLSLTLLFFLFYSCEYDTDDVYVSDIEEMEPEFPTMELDLEDSVVIIYEVTTFHYSVSLEEQIYQGTEIYLNGKLIQQNEGSAGSFTLNLSDGTYTLQIFIYTTSGSESFRSKLGGEDYVFTKSWKIIAETPEISRVKFTSVGVVDGQLKLEWERYDSYRFSSYRVIMDKPNDWVFQNCVDSTSIIDPYFVGGTHTYYLSVERYDKVIIPCDTFTYSASNPISYELDDAFQLTLHWPPCDVPANFSSYQLYMGETDWYESRVFVSGELNDTTVTIPFGLYPDQNFMLVIHSKTKRNGAGEYETNRVVESGEQIPYYSKLSQTMYPPFLIYSGYNRYNPMDGTITPYTNYYQDRVFGVAPDNQVLMSRTALFDTETLLPVKILQNIPEIIMVIGGRGVTLTTNGKAFLEYSPALLYDLQGDSLDHYMHLRGYGSICSPNGEYFLAYDDGELMMIQWKDRNENQLGTIPYPDFYYDFLPDSVYSSFAYVADGNLNIWSCDNMTMENSVPTEAANYVGCDPVTGTVLCSKPGKLYFYHRDDLSLIGEMLVSTAFYVNQSIHANIVGFMNNKLYLRGTGSAYLFDLEPWFQTILPR